MEGTAPVKSGSLHFLRSPVREFPFPEMDFINIRKIYI